MAHQGVKRTFAPPAVSSINMARRRVISEEDREKFEAEAECIEVLAVPRKLLGKIIGKNGTTIADIYRRTGATVNASNQASDPIHVRVAGSRESVDAAVHEVHALMDEVNEPLTSGIVLEVSRLGAGNLMGKNGVVINDIQDTTGARLVINWDTSPVTVRISGEASCIAEAERIVMGIVGDLAADKFMPPVPVQKAKSANPKLKSFEHEDIFEVPKKYIRKIIGAGGKTIATIARNTGTTINARDQTHDPVRVKIGGMPKQIQKAREQLEALVASAEGRFREGVRIEVPNCMIGKLIGNSGAIINTIQRDTGAKIDVMWDHIPLIVNISGDDRHIAMAEQIIRTHVLEQMAPLIDYVTFPLSKEAAIIGDKCSRLAELQNQTGAAIEVDESLRSALRIRLEGSPHQIERAKELLPKAAEAKAKAKGRPAFKPPDSSFFAEQDSIGQAATTPSLPPPVSMLPITETVDLPEGLAEVVLAQARDMEAKHKVRMHVDHSANQLAIHGQQSAVQGAVEAVKALSKGGWVQAPNGNWEWQSADFQASHQGYGGACSQARSTASSATVASKFQMPSEPGQDKFVLYLDELSMPQRPEVLPAATDCELFLDPLPAAAGAKLDALLASFGTVRSVEVLPQKNKGYVKFSRSYEALECLIATTGASWSEAERAVNSDKFWIWTQQNHAERKTQQRNHLGNCSYPCSFSEKLFGKTSKARDRFMHEMMEGSGVTALRFDNTRGRFAAKGKQHEIKKLQGLLEEHVLRVHTILRKAVSGLPRPRTVTAWGLPGSWLSQEELVTCVFEPHGDIETYTFTAEDTAEVAYKHPDSAATAAEKLSGLEMESDQVVRCRLSYGTQGIQSTSEGSTDMMAQPVGIEVDVPDEEEDMLHSTLVGGSKSKSNDRKKQPFVPPGQGGSQGAAPTRPPVAPSSAPPRPSRRT